MKSQRAEGGDAEQREELPGAWRTQIISDYRLFTD